MRCNMLKHLRNYFLTGLLVLLPLLVSVKLLIWGFNIINGLAGGDFISRYLAEKFRIEIPGAGLIILILLILFTGLFAQNYIGKKLIGLGELVLHKIPIVNSIYGTTKQITEGFVKTEKTAFRKVVLVEYPRRGVYSPGFLTGVSPTEAVQKTETPLVNVFIPTVPNPTTGFLIFVPEDQGIYLDMSIEDGFKLILSAGVIKPE